MSTRAKALYALAVVAGGLAFPYVSRAFWTSVVTLAGWLGCL